MFWIVSILPLIYNFSSCNILICMQKHRRTKHSSLEKYTSHTLFEMVRKGYVWEVSWRQNCNILTPSSSGYCSTSFSSCGAAQLGALKAQLSAGSGSHGFELQQLTPNCKLKNFPVAPGYIIVWHPPASCERHICTQFNPSTVKVILWYLRPDAPVIYTGKFLIRVLGRVGGQYATQSPFVSQNPREF